MAAPVLPRPVAGNTLCFLYHLLTTARVSVAQGYTPKSQMWPIPKLRDGLPVQLTPA